MDYLYIMKRYINLALIPALFAVIFTISSCTKGESKIELFEDFSSSEEDVKQIIVDETKPEEASEGTFRQVDLDFIKRFHIGYLAFDVADIYFEVKPVKVTSDYIRYKTRVYSRTNGIVDYFMGWLSNTVGYAKVFENKTVPESFRTKVRHKKKTREIELVFDETGKNLVVEKVTPPDKRGKRPAVAESLKTGAFDPISGFLEARRLIKKAVEVGKVNSSRMYNFTLPVYDGRRRTDFLFALKKIKSSGLLELSMGQNAVGGYTNRELSKDEGINRSKFVIMIDPTSYLPVEVIGHHPLGTASAEYIKDCSQKFEECIKSK